MKTKGRQGLSPAPRRRNAERTRAEILAAAIREFSERGLNGARVDSIAARTRTNKRMIYYYFKSKRQLFIAVLEDAYRRIREAERALRLDDLPPYYQEQVRATIAATSLESARGIVATLRGKARECIAQREARAQATQKPTPSASPTPTVSGTPTSSATPGPSATPDGSPTPRATMATPTPTPTPTPSIPPAPEEC